MTNSVSVRTQPAQLIYIVDDAATDRLSLEFTLKQAGFSVETFASSEAVKHRLTETHQLPDLIIMDVVMPDENGFSTTRLLHKAPSTEHIPVILLSSKNQESDKAWGLKQGAVAYLCKPVQGSELISTVQRYVLPIKAA
jgi:twitching motility two-component system response regulator PilH